jgi:hypothetical protein
MDFRTTRVSSLKKEYNSANFAAGYIINRRTHHNSLCRDKNKHWVTLLRMHHLSPDPSLAA